MCVISNELTEFHATLIAIGVDDPIGMCAEAFDIEREQVERELQVETAQ